MFTISLIHTLQAVAHAPGEHPARGKD